MLNGTPHLNRCRIRAACFLLFKKKSPAAAFSPHGRRISVSFTILKSFAFLSTPPHPPPETDTRVREGRRAIRNVTRNCDGDERWRSRICSVSLSNFPLLLKESSFFSVRSAATPTNSNIAHVWSTVSQSGGAPRVRCHSFI